MIFDYLADMWHLALQGSRQGILFYGSLYCLLVCGYSVIFQMKIRSWPPTRGNLVRSNIGAGVVNSEKSDQSFMIDVLYEYTVGGIKHKGNRLSGWLIWVTYNLRFLLQKQLEGITKNEDGSVIVFYNPNNPQKSFLIKPNSLGLAFTWVLAIFPMFYFWLEYYR